MSNVISLIQIILGIVVASLILLQSKGTGLGSTFGGDMGFYGTKRGAEKMLFTTTIILSVLFLTSLIMGAAF